MKTKLRRWLARKLAPLAYQLGYSDGWEDSIGRRIR
jgi:hypothetical protein